MSLRLLEIVALAAMGLGALRLLGSWLAKPSEPRGAGAYDRAHRYVCVDDDGVPHELNTDETEHLNTEYHGADGARPYIKSSYKQLTPDGKIGGYLLKRKLPQGLAIVPPEG